MKTTRRGLIGLSGAAALSTFVSAPALAAVEPLATPAGWDQDIHWKAANLPTGHTIAVRNSLPGSVSYLKRRPFQMHFSAGRLDQLERDLFYGNTWIRSTEMTGLATHYSTFDRAEAQNAVNVIDAAAFANPGRSSIYVVGWGPLQIYMARTADGTAALVLHDWRYVARILHVSPRSNIESLLVHALMRLPTAKGATIYMNADIADGLKDRIGRTDVFRRVPIRVANAIRNDEA